MHIRIAGVTNDSIVDGPGLRLAVFTQGCPHGCPGCHNPNTHDMHGGHDADTAQIVAALYENPLLSGVTLTGGEPMMQPAACAEIARAAHAEGKNVWCYTGFTFERLVLEQNPERMALLRDVDVLVDGPFVYSQRSLDLRFCGSRNQRLIDVPQSLVQKRVVVCKI